MNQSNGSFRVLVVEDDWWIANQIQLILHDAGFEVIGPVAELAPALAMAHSEEICAALLDIEIGPDVDVYPVADRAPGAGVPLRIRHRGATDQTATEHADRPLVAKPFQPASIEMVIKVLAPAPQTALH